MVKYIGRIYKHSQYQLSTLSLKAPVSSSSYPQTSSAIELTTTSIPSVIDKIKTILCCIPKIPSRMIQPSQTMTKYSLVRQQKQTFIIPTIPTPNHRTKRIATTSSSILNLNIPAILPTVGK